MEAIFLSAEKETSTPVEATITGTVPDWLEGSLFRNGPALFEIGEDKYNHLFDGMAMVHKYSIKDGKVMYSDRYIRSDSYEKNMAKNRIVCTEFGTVAHPDPCKSLYDRFFSYFQPPTKESTDNTVVHVFPSGDHIFAATETNFLRRLDPSNLETLGGKVDIKDKVSVNNATAHPHLDNDGTMHNLGNIYQGKPHYAIIRMTPPKPGTDDLCDTAEVVAKIPAQWPMYPGYHHSFAMTENYYILIESPLVINVMKIMTSNLLSRPFAQAMDFYGNYPTHFHIIDKKTGEKVHADYSISTDTFIVFHQSNAYEEDGNIVLDTCSFTQSAPYDTVRLDRLQSPGVEERLAKDEKPTLRRYVLPLCDLNKAEIDEEVAKVSHSEASSKKTGANTVWCTHEQLTEMHMEFPQINYKNYNMKKYGHCYGLGYLSTLGDCLVKVDVEAKTHKVWLEEGAYPGEPIFVARPGATEEDDGVVLSVLLETGPDRHANLLILDAKDFTEIARARINVKIPRDFHGSFCPQFL